MILSFWTDMPGQTVQTQIRLLRAVWSGSTLFAILSASFVCIVWIHYSMVELHSLNFRVITTNILGVRIFRNFMVVTAIFRVSKYLWILRFGIEQEPIQKSFFQTWGYIMVTRKMSEQVSHPLPHHLYSTEFSWCFGLFGPGLRFCIHPKLSSLSF